MKIILEREEGQQVKMVWSLLFVSLIASAAPCTVQNLTLTGNTSQSSVYTKGEVLYSSERAIDGNEQECAHTLNKKNSWWRIDLLGVYDISAIRIYNIKQENIQMTNTQIYIGNSRKKNGTTNSLCANITAFNLGDWNVFDCEKKLSGRYITVFSKEERHLILCEVEVKVCGTRKESPFQLIKQKMIWEDALYYCRDRDMDLASILNEESQAWAELEAQKADTPFVWLGLHYTCTLGFWFWVDDHPMCFTHWDQKNKKEECNMSAAMQAQKGHWFSKCVYKTFNFICAK